MGRHAQEAAGLAIRSSGREQLKMSAVWAILAALASVVFGQGSAQVSMEPPHNSGQSITAAFEGWYLNPDGSANIMLGYYNRNLTEVLDIPVGPNNRVDP